MDPINVNLNIYQTLAAATAVYYVGVLLRIKVTFLRRYCLPAPVIGTQHLDSAGPETGTDIAIDISTKANGEEGPGCFNG